MNKRMLLVRVYISEADHGRKGNLLDEVMDLLHEELRVHGVTVFRGIAGFGSNGVVHSADLLRLTQKLPLVVEFYDEQEIVERAIESLQTMIPSGHIITWPVDCITKQQLN